MMELIKAMKGGLTGYFTPYSWKVGKPEKHGWRKIGVTSEAVMVEAEAIDLKKTEITVTEIPVDGEPEKSDPIVRKEVVKEIETTDDDLYPTDDEIRAELTEKGVKFHPKLGTVKLRALYDANKE